MNLNKHIISLCSNTFEEQKQRIEFGNFSTEVIKEILSRLVVKPKFLTRDGVASWQDDYCTTIKYRIVCKCWRNLIDEILESTVVSMMELWIPNRLSSEMFPRTIFKLRVHESGNIIHTPPFMIKYNGTNPFPGKNFAFSEGYPLFEHKEQFTYANHVISKFGCHLSILCFSGIKLLLTGLCNILKASKNLKALVLNCVFLCEEGEFDLYSCTFNLPKLKKLKTLVIGEKCTVCSKVVNKNDGMAYKNVVQTYHWLFKTYACNLESLQMHCSSHIKTNQLKKLKQLSINTLSLSYLQELGEAVALERLSVCRYGETTNQVFGDFYDFVKIAHRFSDTIKELYWDILRLEFAASKDQIVLKDLRDQEIKQIKFPLVIKLTTNYPEHKDDQHILLDTVLQNFTSLRHLVLLRYVSYWSAVPFYSAKEIQVPSEQPAIIDQMWCACTNLEKVSITSRVYNENDRGYDYIQSNFMRPPK